MAIAETNLSQSDAALPVQRVLIVDDDADINLLLQARLRAQGYQVTSALTGEEALLLLADDATDIVFLDVSMPGMSGLDVLEQIRRQWLDLAVIMTTAFGSEQVAIDALRRGADDYLRKPFEPGEFQAVLSRTVRRLELSRQNRALRQQLDEKRRQLETELARAAQVQADLLPGTHFALPGFDLAGRCLPAREVGGDFYDWRLSQGGRLTFVVGDITGKGMPAAILMATVRAVIRAVVRDSALKEAMRYVTNGVMQDLQRSERFVTLFVGQLDVATRRLRYVDAGHGHVFMWRANGTIETLEARGMPLGTFAEMEYAEGECTFGPGDALVIYSDGLIDARPDLQLNCQALVQYLGGATSATEMVERLVGLATTPAPFPDDLTVLVLYCYPVA